MMADVPVYHCIRNAESAVRDAGIGAGAWTFAPVGLLAPATGDSGGAPATIVRCRWDHERLYIRFEAVDADMWGTYTGRDDPLYDEEVVEVFLCPTGDVRRYFEIEVSPRGVVFDAAIHNPHLDRTDMETDRAWTCAGLIADVQTTAPVHKVPPAQRTVHGPAGRWTVDLAIPFRSLGLPGPPRPGDEWRVNFYRIDRGEKDAYLAWSPTLKRPVDFHVPARFGVLRFEDDASSLELPGKWSRDQAVEWGKGAGWIVGCNFTPSTASNQLEMWQAATFDPDTIARELGYARDVGMNAVRVYLHDLVWEQDRAGFLDRIRKFLALADACGIKTVFVLFDDCWNPDPAIGPQKQPEPGVHNSRWVQSPARQVKQDPLLWGRLRDYVTGLIAALRDDDRILMWDLYNEPGNSDYCAGSWPLLYGAFEWARAARPTQPLSVGVWAQLGTLNAFQLANSDVVTFHNYEDAASLKAQIGQLKDLGRPIVCTEWMARPTSVIGTHLPVFRETGVGCMMWGLVAGKTQTIYPWRSPGGGPEPDPWFHDLLRPDGSPYRPEEVETLRKMTGRQG